MVKGISRQVIVVQSPDRDLFEQAIFILRSDASEEGISEEQLLQEAQKIIRGSSREKKRSAYALGILYALSGAAATGVVWGLSLLL